jgi:hypothetical protein
LVDLTDFVRALEEVDMTGIGDGVARRGEERVVPADEAGIVARNHPVAAEFERMMHLPPDPVGPEVPADVPVETPPPDAVPGESPEEHPDSPPRENPDDVPAEMLEREGAGDPAK